MGAALLPAIQARLVLLVNHVLSREPQAAARMQAHSGRHLRIEWMGAPAWLPTPPSTTVKVTPIGWFELDEPLADPAEMGLRLQLEVPGPDQWLALVAGQAFPRVQVEGDAALAADIQWLVDNLRWDIEADLAELMNPIVAHELVRAGRAAATALRAFVPSAASAAEPARP